MYVLETPKLQDFKSASKNEHYCQIDSKAFSHAKRKKNRLRRADSCYKTFY